MLAAVRAAPLTVFLAMIAVPLTMTAVAILAGLFARRQARVVDETPATPIADAEEGYRHISGHVVPVESAPLVAPLTGSPCCWYSMTVEHWTRPGHDTNRRHEWVAVRSETSSVPLLVRDDSGLCLVRLHGADITPTDRSRWTGSTLEPEDRNPPRHRPCDNARGMVQVSGLPGHEYRYREERIYAGDPVLVVGMLSRRARDEDASELPPLERLTDTAMARGNSRQPLVISTTSAGAHVAMYELGSQAAFLIALVPFGIAVLMLMARLR